MNHLFRVVHAVARTPIAIRYPLSQVRLVHTEKHMRAVFAVLDLLVDTQNYPGNARGAQ